MHIKQLQYLIEISKHRSMNKACEVLFISQQALSLSMKSLEDELGFKVLNRTPQGISLTEEGDKLVEISENFIAELTQLKLGHDSINLMGDIDLYTPDTLLDSFLAKPLSEIIKEYPKLNIKVHTFPYEKTLRTLRAKNLPYCFWYQCYIDEENIMGDIPEGYNFFPIMKSKYFCVVHRNHHFKNRKTVSLKDMATENFISHMPSEYVLDKIWQSANLTPKCTFVPNTAMLNEMLAMNAGIAFSALSVNHLKSYVYRDRDLINIPLEESVIAEIGYLIPKSQPLDARLNNFLWLIGKKINNI